MSFMCGCLESVHNKHVTWCFVKSDFCYFSLVSSYFSFYLFYLFFFLSFFYWPKRQCTTHITPVFVGKLFIWWHRQSWSKYCNTSGHGMLWKKIQEKSQTKAGQVLENKPQMFPLARAFIRNRSKLKHTDRTSYISRAFIWRESPQWWHDENTKTKIAQLQRKQSNIQGVSWKRIKRLTKIIKVISKKKRR